MKNPFRYIILFLCSVMVCFFVTIGSAEAARDVSCDNVSSVSSSDSGETVNAQGMFDDGILKDMQTFMRMVYVQLAKVMMIGHSLMCYAEKVDTTCIGLKGVVCFVELINLSLFISGAVIYVVAILMAMSIGMYFVDISFKLGFAVLFMPVAIALWPFPPTKNKLSENLSVIIRNAMLFTLVAIGVSFSVTIISNSLIDTGTGQDGWSAFWEAVATKRTETLVKNFAFYHIHFLVVGAGLIFGFKILASSVNDYLAYFFSDAVFGSSSPMHHMGTQAVGMVAQNTVKPAASFVGDVAKTQAGRAIAGVGSGIAMLGSAQGRQQAAANIRKGASSVKRVVTNPRQTYNQVMQKAGEKANQGIQTLGKLEAELRETKRLLNPFKRMERINAENEKKTAEINANYKAFGAKAENLIAHGGGKMRNAAANIAADTAAAGINTFNKVSGNNKKFVTGDDVKGAVNSALESAKEDLKNAPKAGVIKAATLAHNTAQVMSGNAGAIKSEEEVRQNLHNMKENVKSVAGATAEIVKDTGKLAGAAVANSKLGQETVKAWQNSNQAPITLQPSALISAPFKLAKGTLKGAYNMTFHPQKTIRKLAQNADELKNTQINKQIIMEKTGQIVARTIKGTGQDMKKVAEGAAFTFGNVLKDFGKSLQDNSKNGKSSGFTSWDDINAKAEAKAEAKKEHSEYFSSLADKYDEE